MKIQINSVTIDESSITVIIELKSIIRELESFRLDDDVRRSIIDEISDAYVQKNLSSILDTIDFKKVTNAIILRSADRVVGK